MYKLNRLLEEFTEQSKNILGENLAGIYLHGSAAMGCFNEKKSDIDLIVVVKREMSYEEKLRYMDMVVKLNSHAPSKGIEMSVVRKNVCKPFFYPTPFELHFSEAHLEWYRAAPSDYAEKMNGTDKDLAAHFTVIYHRGKCLFGEEIKSVFEKVSGENYFDSIWNDIENAEEDIIENTVYIILNLCRVLAYKQNELVLSKREGGEWGLKNVPVKYRELIRQALDDYASVRPIRPNEKYEVEFAKYMTEQIREKP